MASQTILERFRDISSIAASVVGNTEAEDQHMALALLTYNEIMGTTHTITTNSTGDLMVNDAIAFLATSYVYQKLMRTKMYKDTGMLEWQRFYQGALEIMYAVDPTKVMYVESRDIYIVRDPEVTTKPFNYSIYRDNEGASSTTGGGA